MAIFMAGNVRTREREMVAHKSEAARKKFSHSSLVFSTEAGEKKIDKDQVKM